MCLYNKVHSDIIFSLCFCHTVHDICITHHQHSIYNLKTALNIKNGKSLKIYGDNF